MTFPEWLHTKLKDAGEVGDLARDVARDRSWPRDAVDLTGFRLHLIHRSASLEARQTLERVWSEYLREI